MYLLYIILGAIDEVIIESLSKSRVKTETSRKDWFELCKEFEKTLYREVDLNKGQISKIVFFNRSLEFF